MTKLASISYALIGILIVQLVFITVVNILLFNNSVGGAIGSHMLGKYSIIEPLH